MSRATSDAALRAIERIGDPGWGIFLTVHQAERHEVLARLPRVGDAWIDEAFAVACRVAASTMLLDDPDHGPYEWSHQLTLPVGLWHAHRRHADPIEALDVALTHVVAFRAGFSRGPIGPYAPVDPGINVIDALDEEPDVAAAAVFHSPDPEEALITTLVTAVSAEHDAHAVKYVHACLQARARDTTSSRLYLAAAAHLLAWWRRNPPADDPLT